jgi:ParB family chromosome partitioning protein
MLYRKTSRELLAENSPDSNTQIQRYIRLTELEPQLLDLMDEGKLGFRPAVELSYLNRYEQVLLIELIESEGKYPSLAQAAKMKKLSHELKLNESIIEVIMSEDIANDYKVTIKGDKLRQYFPENYTPLQMENKIIELLETWQHNRQQDLEQ